MKKVTVFGAGFVTKPAVDYFLDDCGYQVTVTSLQLSEAERLVAGRENGTALTWREEQTETLDRLVSESDLVLSMVPPPLHPIIAKACLRHKRDMITTSYISPELEALDQQCKDKGILILSEIGEDPGIDNMITKSMIDQIKRESGSVRAIKSYGAGLPAFENNNNPFGYKFSWSPMGLISAAKSSAAYLEKGQRIDVLAECLFDHHWLIDLDGIGTFETYPNRDAEKYLECFGLEKDVSLFRGLLRFTGWCNTMKCFSELNLFDSETVRDFEGLTYQDFMSRLIGEQKGDDVQQKTANLLGLRSGDDSIKRMNWLGLFDDDPIQTKTGTNSDLLLERMTRKLAYEPLEKDMVIIYTSILAEFPSAIEKRITSLVMKGARGGDTAMSRAVSVPAALAAERVLQKKVSLKGVQRPTDPEIYEPVLKKLHEIGFHFSTKTVKMKDQAHEGLL